MRIFLVFIVLVFSILSSKGQDMPKIVPPSPEASALATFTDIPVSHYTGLPSISVPIYTIQQKGVQIPISLSYHARGVMVSATAPRTGTGWSLQYGGSISRQVRGKGDELLNHGYLVNGNHFMTYSTDISTREAVDGNEVIANDEHGGYDHYPDQFTFSAAGVSGKFVLSYEDGEPVIQSFGDVKISYTRGPSGNGFNSIDSFTVIDSKGNTYYFGISKDGLRKAQDYQNSVGMSIDYNGNVNLDPSSSTDNRVFSAWKLMDIETAYGDVISYSYTSDGSATYYRKSLDKHIVTSDSPNSYQNGSNLQMIQTRISKITNHEKQLSKIEFNNGRDYIVFTKSQSNRLDFEGKSLDKISIYNEDKLIKSYKLNYSYTTSTDTSNMLHHINFGLYGNNPNRMFLASVEEEGSDGQKLPPYVFTYDSEVLPSMYSSRQDYWGYYNGATNNGPFTRLFEYGSYTPDRRVDTLKSEAGILKEIQYPTGGKTKLTYEHNKGYLPNDFSRLKIPNVNPTATSAQQIILKKGDFLPFLSARTLTLPASTQITYNIQCNYFREVGDTTTPDCPFNFVVGSEQIPVGQNIVRYTPVTTDGFSDVAISVHAQNSTQYGEDFYNDPSFDFTITITYTDPDNPTFIYGAGKRIKKIENIDESGNAIVKEYEYTFPADPDIQSEPIQSGGIIGLPAFFNRRKHDDASYVNYTKYYDATSAFGGMQPNSIGYSSVIEYHGTKENNIGKTEYTFTNLSDTGGDYYEFPYHPPTDNEWLRGKNIKTKVFKRQEDGGYTLAKEVYNKYLYGDNEYAADFEYVGLLHANFVFTPNWMELNWYENVPLELTNSRTLSKLPLFMRRRKAVGADMNDLSNWHYRIYHLTGGTLNLKRTTTKDYYDNGSINETVTENFFDYNKHYQQKSTKVTDSKGNIIESKNYYPTDATQVHPNYSSSAELSEQVSRIGDLLTDHRFEVVQTESFKNGVLQSKLQNRYLKHNGIIMPKSVMTAKGSSDLEERIVYHSYDADENVREVSKKDGTPIVYVWGYNRTLPVAKIEGATYSEVQSYVSAIETASNTDDDRTVDTISGTNRTFVGKEGALRNALQTLRNGLPNAQVTTFTYDPLIGTTSITDVRGRTLYYHYDSFNRLESVRDHDGNTVNKTEYNYKN